MPRLHFSVDHETAHRLAERARKAGLTLPATLARIARRESGESWPERYFEVVGSCDGFGLEEPDDPLPDEVPL